MRKMCHVFFFTLIMLFTMILSCNDSGTNSQESGGEEYFPLAEDNFWLYDYVESSGQWYDQIVDVTQHNPPWYNSINGYQYRWKDGAFYKRVDQMDELGYMWIPVKKEVGTRFNVDGANYWEITSMTTDVTTPAGSYSCIVISRFNEQGLYSKRYYAKNVGLVKYEIFGTYESEPTHGEVLRSYTVVN